MPRNERESTSSNKRKPLAGSEAKGYGGKKNSKGQDTNFSKSESKNGSYGYDANRQYRSSESGNYGNWEGGAYNEFDPKFDEDSEDKDDRRYRVERKQEPSTPQHPNRDNPYGTADARKGRNKKAGGHHKSKKQSDAPTAKKSKASQRDDRDEEYFDRATYNERESQSQGRRHEQDYQNDDRYNDNRNREPSGYTPRYQTEMRSRENSSRDRGDRYERSSRPLTREPAHDHDEYRAQERTRRNFRPETSRQSEDDRNYERYQNDQSGHEATRYDDNDRYGYSSDRGMYGHYHVRPYNRNEEPEHDRERGLRNSGHDMISDYGAGEGRGYFAGRDSGHNYANEFYEDTDNERLREARRNYAYRHGYDETDNRGSDFTPTRTRGISPGFDEMSDRTTRKAASPTKRGAKKGSKKMARAAKTAMSKSKKKASTKSKSKSKSRTTKR